MVADLSQSMMVTWSIALFEHLDALLNNLESAVGGAEQISYSETAWKLAEASFPKIVEDANKLYDEFRAKWVQRFSTDEVLRLLLEGGDFLTKDDEKGWTLAVKNNKQDINAFYSATIHLLVSDAEPLFVRMHGRVMQLQEKLCKYWHGESAVDAVSKLLPCLESSLREKENALVVSLRSSLNALAKKRFAAAFATKGSPYYPTAASCARNVGRFWNPHYAYENGFLAFTDDFCDYARGLTLYVIEWYHSKWSLFLRGFSRGQLNLFETMASSEA